ncbi:F-actin-capping protein subunit beta [Chytriomyces cf. hyalinus JEL632]|nr:F-actin-capping protein subunit beta [Chytriomyces cf. hyalinus JEL632]
MSEEQFDLALDLMRRLAPSNTRNNLVRLVKLVGPELEEELFSAVDLPLTTGTCGKSGRQYLKCDYNRDEQSYRSPWSSEYDPPLPEGNQPSFRLRRLEVALNDAFDVYRNLYYEGGDIFAGVVLVKKGITDGVAETGAWDSIHVIEVEEKSKAAHYKLTSTIILNLIHGKQNIGELNLSGNLTRQAEHDLPLDDPSGHVGNIGRIIEDMEIKMRNALHEIYFGKTKDIANDLRSVQSLAEAKNKPIFRRSWLGNY